MGNPRQRHKARSSAHKVVKHSRHAKRNLRKMKPIRGPKALQDAWDKTKTLRQNYAAMGLVGSLKQADSGGSEHPLITQTRSEGIATLSQTSMGKPSEAGPSSLPRGFGKILRDSEGNVIGVELPEEKASEEDMEGEGMSADNEAPPQTELVNALEKLAETARPVQRFSSSGEVAVLRKLLDKHGRDFEAMAMDRRMNEWQRTAGQLQRAMKKARLI